MSAAPREKRCPRCGRPLPPEAFGTTSGYCWECTRERAVVYRSELDGRWKRARGHARYHARERLGRRERAVARSASMTQAQRREVAKTTAYRATLHGRWRVARASARCNAKNRARSAGRREAMEAVWSERRSICGSGEGASA